MKTKLINALVICTLTSAVSFGCGQPQEDFEESGSVKPVAGQILFESTRDYLDPGYGTENKQTHGFEVYLMNADGSSQTRLTFTGFGGMRSPQWTPDGQYIIYRENEDIAGTAEKPYNETMIMKADGSDPKPLTKELASQWWDVDYYEEHKQWEAALWCNKGLPSGNNTLCLESPEFDNRSDILITNLSVWDRYHYEEINLTNDAAFDVGPVWSADQTKIAFSSNREADLSLCEYSSQPEAGGGYDIFSMNPDGSNIFNITNDPETRDLHPSWSADGKLIVFDSQRCIGSREELAVQIYLINADGSGRVRLTDSKGSNLNPQWRP